MRCDNPAIGADIERRTLGRTGLDVSVLGLGTWQLGGEWGQRFSQSDVDRLIARAGELGVNLIDTAECYGDHVAEALIGAAIRGRRDDWVIATKFGHRFHPERMIAGEWSPVDVRSDHWEPEEVIAQLDRSLEVLDTDHVDVYLFHGGPDEAFDRVELWGALRGEVERGRVRHLGVSIGPADDVYQTRRAAEVGAEVIEVTYNRLNRAAEDGVLAACEELGLGVLVREPLANGYLSGRYSSGNVPGGDDDWRAALEDDEVADRLRQVEEVRERELPAGVPMAEWALAWTLRHPAVHAVVTGTRTIEQLESSARGVSRAAPGAGRG